MLGEELLERFGVRDRLIAAAILCGAIYYLDKVTSATFQAAALYIPVAAVFFGIQRAWVFISFCVVCTLLSAEASVSDQSEADFVNFALNRGVITLVLYSTCLLIYRVNHASDVLRRLATIDPLTGAYNRRHFMELMEREQHRADRYGTAYSILMIDIDRFKNVNDTYGHQVGDQAIKAMADACKRSTRPTDMVARYGGEEFIITLTHTVEAGALTVAERLRETVAKVVLPTDRGPLSFTVSIGVSTYAKKSTIEQIIGRADQALYRAKQTGRNRVCAEARLEAAIPA